MSDSRMGPDKYKVGQLCRLVNPRNYPQYDGAVVTVVEQRRWRMDSQRNYKHYSYAVDIPASRPDYETPWLCAEEHQLLPISDRDEPGNWANCAWQPKMNTIRYIEELLK